MVYFIRPAAPSFSEQYRPPQQQTKKDSLSQRLNPRIFLSCEQCRWHTWDELDHQSQFRYLIAATLLTSSLTALAYGIYDISMRRF